MRTFIKFRLQEVEEKRSNESLRVKDALSSQKWSLPTICRNAVYHFINAKLITSTYDE